MRSFFKTFFATLLALVVFSGLVLVIAMVIIAGVAAGKEVKTGEKAVIIIDLSDHFAEVEPSDPLDEFTGQDKSTPPSLSKLVRLIDHAKNNSSVKGIYIKAESNNNGYASSEELRDAIINFRSSGKFVYAYGNTISQKAYYVANAANKIYCNPAGGIEWRGLTMQMPFIKGTLEKLEVEPQIFYAGKFKSATEPLREKQMTESNETQSREILRDLYSQFLLNTSATRKIDTSMLQKFADSNSLQFAYGALTNKMID
jgi:protease IV